MNFSYLKSRLVWTNIVTIAYFFFGAILQVYPSVPAINDIVLGLTTVLNVYFHVNPSQTYHPVTS